MSAPDLRIASSKLSHNITSGRMHCGLLWIVCIAVPATAMLLWLLSRQSIDGHSRTMPRSASGSLNEMQLWW